MDELREFILPACGLFWSVVGTWWIFASYRRRHEGREGSEPALESSGTCKKKSARRPLQTRFTGILWLGIGIATLCFSGIRVATAPAAAAEPRVENGPLAEIVTQHVERDFEEKTRVGMVVGAVANGEEVLLGFGRCRLGNSKAPDSDTVFEIGSISKVFTGLLLANRVESGELELGDRIADLLPDGWSLSEEAREVTLQHCTTHTSGFPRLPANGFGIGNLGDALFGGDPYRDYSEDQFREALATVHLEFEPGTKQQYSNFAVGLLGFVLATQNGSDYETLLRREICEPLGMARTVIAGREWHREHAPAQYRGALKLGPMLLGLGSSDWQLPNHLAGAGGIRSTGGDMMTFLKANMGRIPTDLDAAIRRSHQELYLVRAGKAIGMNWVRSLDTDISQNILWHNGGTGGFRTYLGFTEDRQIGVFVLSNTSTSVDELAKEIIKALVRDPSYGGQKPVTEHGFAKVAPYTGVRWENDRPIVCVQSRWSPLVSIDTPHRMADQKSLDSEQHTRGWHVLEPVSRSRRRSCSGTGVLGRGPLLPPNRTTGPWLGRTHRRRPPLGPLPFPPTSPHRIFSAQCPFFLLTNRCTSVYYTHRDSSQPNRQRLRLSPRSLKTSSLAPHFRAPFSTHDH